MKQGKLWIISLAALLAACSPAAQPAQEDGNQLDSASQATESIAPEASIEDLDAVAQQLLSALLSKDADVIQRLEPSPGAYVENDELRPEIVAFLDSSNPSTGRRSLHQLSELGNLDVVIAAQGENRAFAIYVPHRFRDRVGDPDFLETRWLRDYFACEFRATPSGWKLGGSFCFDETDGPYPGEY